MALALGGVVSTASIVVAGLVAVLGVVGYQNRRAKLSAIRSAFNDVIGLLAAEDVERQLAGAILLRRFFDPSSELGIRNWFLRRRAPYAKEAQSVMAAVLRGLPHGDLQKLLADGLVHADSLQEADLQRTNLQGAYLAPAGAQAAHYSGLTSTGLTSAERHSRAPGPEVLSSTRRGFTTRCSGTPISAKQASLKPTYRAPISAVPV